MINMSSERTAMQKRLYEASLSGSVSDLERLEREDPLILNRAVVSLSPPYFDSETPLHVAALCGHSDFTRALLSRKPRLATELDSTRCTPLHLASAEGHIEIVRQLLDVTHDVCEARDEDGRTPLHLAAMKGRVEVIKQLIRARPESIREKIEGRGGGGETVLHLCVKYNRLEALRTLVDELRSRNEIAFVNSEDNSGNTVLHLAAALKQLETIEYLFQVESVKEHANTKNKNGSTALDVVEHCLNRDLKNMEIREFLLQVGVRRARDLKTLLPASLTDEEIKTLPDNPQTSLPDNPDNPQTSLQAPPIPLTGEEMRTLPDDNPQTQLSWKSITRYWNKYFKVDDGWFKEVRGHLITASTLTITMAYQAGLSPPGSVWQDDSSSGGTNQNTNGDAHVLGTSIAGSRDAHAYDFFISLNTASLIASLSTLLLALSGFPPENKLLVFLLILTMFCSFTCMAFAYMLAVEVISPDPSLQSVDSIVSISLYAWFGICIFVLLVHTSRFFLWLCRKYREQVKKKRLARRSKENNVHPMPQSNFLEWLRHKYGELVQKRWLTRRPNENNANPMP